MVDIFLLQLSEGEKKKPKQTENSEEILANVLLMETEAPYPAPCRRARSTRKSETQGIFCATETTHIPAEGQTVISDPETRAPVPGGAK